MMTSLRGRLLFAMGVVSAIAMVLAGWLSTHEVKLELDQVATTAGPIENFDRLAIPLKEYYARTGTWSGVDATLREVSAAAKRRVVLVAPDGKPVGLAPESLAQSRVEIGPGHLLTVELRNAESTQKMQVVNAPHADMRGSDGTAWGTVYFGAPSDSSRSAILPDKSSLFSTLLKRLIPALVIVLLLALLATIGLSRRILRPLEKMKIAVQQMERGDLTQRVEVISSDEIGDLARAFNSMAENLSRTEQLRRNMVADVAHELRTPLTNIRCQIEAIEDGLAVSNREVLSSLHEETMLLSRMIDDLRDLALADAGQLVIDPQPVSLVETIDNVTTALRARLATANVHLDVEIPGELPLVRADSVRIGQVLRNLLENALAQTVSGGTIGIRAINRSGEVRIEVRDSGPEISPEHVPQIFERFYRTDPSRSRKTGGAGLGLAIVQQIVNAHGGRVEVDSVPGHGALFIVALPSSET